MGRPSVRLLVVLLVAVLPPLVAFAIVRAVAADALAQMGEGTVLLIATLLASGWTGIVAIIASRLMADEARSMLDLARRGGAGDEGLTNAQRYLAEALEERNRQIAELAIQVRAAPIAQDVSAVVRSVVEAARSMTRDPTWELGVLGGTAPQTLAPGVYGAETSPEPTPLGPLHAWAGTLEMTEDGVHGARHAEGPWGAFMVIDVGTGEELRAILLAPWEGRSVPSPAELDLMALLGQHAATAVEHALLYGRLREQTDALNRMAAVQSDFLRGVSHDLQTPLTSIRALAAELRDQPNLTSAARDDLESIAHQADRLRRMVSQLLAVSRLEAGELRPRQEVFRAEPIVRRTWDALRADRRFELTVDGPPHLLVGDPDRFEQVLWAVLDNAVKYSTAGSQIGVTVAAGGESPDPDRLTAEITIADEGTGMDAATVAHAFDQFYRSDDARRLAPDGSGIGLYAARGLLAAMGGGIDIASRLGQGTTIHLTLPAEPAEG